MEFEQWVVRTIGERDLCLLRGGELDRILAPILDTLWGHGIHQLGHLAMAVATSIPIHVVFLFGRAFEHCHIDCLERTATLQAGVG